MKACILFTDVKASSKLWADHPDEMLNRIMKHERIIRKYISKHNGLLLKTIGDAVMAKFDTLKDGILCCIDTQKMLKKMPLRFKNSSDILQIRIGIAYGDIEQRKISIQNCTLVDVFGPTVNLASRMESKISKVGGFAVLADDISNDDINVIKKECKVQVLRFSDNCNDTKIKRSKRLIVDSCHQSSLLHVNDGLEHIVLSCELI